MYSKCHMSLTMEMYTTHEISDITGNIMCPCLELYMKCEISDITGNVMFPCLGIVHEM